MALLRGKHKKQPKGVWLDESAMPTSPATSASSSPPETTITADGTVFISGTPKETKESVTEYVEKTRAEYKQSLQTLIDAAKKLRKEPEAPLAPAVHPFAPQQIRQETAAPQAVPQPVVPPAAQQPSVVFSPAPQTSVIKPPQPESPGNPAAAPFVQERQTPPPTGPWHWMPTPETPGFLKNNRLTTRSANSKDPERLKYGRIITADFDEQKPPIIPVISSFFFLMTFVYTTLTLLTFGLILALAITLTNAGIPGFMYLRYYPNVGYLPIVVCAATVVFMYIGYKIRDGSRLSWLLGILSLATVPIAFSVLMPAMSYPLIRLVTIYAGSARTAFQPPTINLVILRQFFSLFLFFEAIQVVLIVTLRSFHFPSRPLGANARTSLLVMIFLFLVPISTVMAYGFVDAQDTDYGLSMVQSQVPYRIYTPDLLPGDRVNATRFIPNEELANLYNAVRVSYDVPLPTLMQTGKGSRITLTQVQVPDTFDLQAFNDKQRETADGELEQTHVSIAESGTGYTATHGATVSLWFITPERSLVMISSQSADLPELVNFGNSLR